MDEEFKENITAKKTWLRGLFILLFAFLLAVARVVTWAVVFLQFLFTLFSGKTNENLLSFGARLARYMYQCLLYVTFNSDEKPFPYADWPSADEAQVSESRVVKKAAPKKARVKKTAKKKAAVKKAESSAEESTQVNQQETESEATESGAEPTDESSGPGIGPGETGEKPDS